MAAVKGAGAMAVEAEMEVEATGEVAAVAEALVAAEWAVAGVAAGCLEEGAAPEARPSAPLEGG